jgi:anti-sigma regulatory factor (Ser/Thr protein kinase)
MTASKPYTATYDGKPEQVRYVRSFVAGILAGCPVAGDAVLLVSEIATNAVCHSNSRNPGGTFIVRAEVRDDYVWVEVEDQGGRWKPGDNRIDGRGHGLDVVREMAGDFGIDGGEHGRVVWFRLGWKP